MEIKTINNFNSVINKEQKLIAIWGYFDGWHLGHQGLLKKMIKIGQELDYQTLVISFDVKPQSILFNEKNFVLSDKTSKIKFLKTLNINNYWEIKFSKALAATSAQDFINWLVNNNVQTVVVSPDVRFGYKGQGNFALLEQSPLQVFSFDDLYESNHEKISSTYIKKLISNQEIVKVNQLLAPNYFTVSGVVVDGIKEGRSLGFPTANLQLAEDYYLPNQGVYLSKTRVDNKFFNSLTIIINRDQKPLVETYILDFNQDIYGQKINVFFLDFLRNNMIFDSKNELINQIKNDEKLAREFFNKNKIVVE